MKYISRDDQRRADTPERRGDPEVQLDGTPIAVDALAQHWTKEADVHRGRSASSNVDSTRGLASSECIAVRDDLRRVSHGLVIDADGLWQVELGSGRRAQLSAARIRRASCALDKWTGSLRVAHVEQDGDGWRLLVDGAPVEQPSQQVDFPFLALAQVPIGHVPEGPAAFGLLSFKCRASGNLLVCDLAPDGSVGPARLLLDAPTLGGAPLAIAGQEVVARVNLRDGDALRAALLRSTDQGRTWTTEALATPPTKTWRLSPAPTPPVVDQGGHLHFPVGGHDGQDAVVLDIVDGYGVVEALRVEGGMPEPLLLAFPKKDSMTLGRFGDGHSDGLGLIMTAAIDGRLYAANSQTGGASYPEPTLLNHEMPAIAAYSATECYTSGRAANTVSMDYLFIEQAEDGRPASRTLHVEQWHMPLPPPVAQARWADGRVEVTLERDANFEEGAVVWEFDDPRVVVTEARLTGPRTALLSTRGVDPRGATLCYEVRSRFYFHQGRAEVR